MMAEIEVRGHGFHVVSLGGGKGRPLVMIHGLLIGNLATWYFTVAPTLAKKRPVILYDLRGHGLSCRTASGYDVETMATDLQAILDTLELDRIDLVGHSYGALVALRAALSRPDRVGRLVLVEAPLPPSRCEELDLLMMTTPEQWLETLPEAFQNMLLSGRRQATRFVESTRALMRETTLLADLRAERDVPEHILERVEMPTLCIYGDQSPLADIGHRINSAIPRSELTMLDGGHALPIEAPGPVGAAIEGFLDG